jgi:hypothetical protein
MDMLSFEDGEIVDLARELAALSGQSLAAAIRGALEEKLGREILLRDSDRNLAARLDEIEHQPEARTSELV